MYILIQTKRKKEWIPAPKNTHWRGYKDVCAGHRPTPISIEASQFRTCHKNPSFTFSRPARCTWADEWAKNSVAEFQFPQLGALDSIDWNHHYLPRSGNEAWMWLQALLENDYQRVSCNTPTVYKSGEGVEICLSDDATIMVLITNPAEAVTHLKPWRNCVATACKLSCTGNGEKILIKPTIVEKFNLCVSLSNVKYAL